MTERYQKRISFTKESAACSTFPHQVHGPRQGAGAGEGPRVHASALVVEAAGAKCPAPRRKRNKSIKGTSNDDRDGKGSLEKDSVIKKGNNDFFFRLWLLLNCGNPKM